MNKGHGGWRWRVARFLNRLSEKLYDATYVEVIYFVDAAGYVNEAIVQSNEYGYGFMVASGPLCDYIREFENVEDADAWLEQKDKERRGE